MADRVIVPLDLDALRRELREFEHRYEQPSADLHRAFERELDETDDERRWATVYAILRHHDAPA